MASTKFATIAMAVTFMLLYVAEAQGGMKRDCHTICRQTGFTGNIGGCACGYTFFQAKRASPYRTLVPSQARLPFLSEILKSRPEVPYRLRPQEQQDDERSSSGSLETSDNGQQMTFL